MCAGGLQRGRWRRSMERESCLASCFVSIRPGVPKSSGKEAEVSQRMRIRSELSLLWTATWIKTHNNGLIVSSIFSHIIAYEVLQIRNFTINSITSLQPLQSSSLKAGWGMGNSQKGSMLCRCNGSLFYITILSDYKEPLLCCPKAVESSPYSCPKAVQTWGLGKQLSQLENRLGWMDPEVLSYPAVLWLCDRSKKPEKLACFLLCWVAGSVDVKLVVNGFQLSERSK